VEATAATQRRTQWAEIAYEAIAPVYDDFTAHHDYELWLGKLLPELERLGLRGRRLLDVGCGTGKSFLPMLERGWEVTGCDISASMVELARWKAEGTARLSVADMRELPVFGRFDLVWSLDDAVNYLLSAEELERALAGMRRNLAPGGLLMFDVNTLQSYRSFFAETEVREARGRKLLWQGRASADTPPGSISEASFEVIGADGEPEIEPELHRQRHFPEEEVREALGRAGLECLDVFGHGFDVVLEQPVDELRHSKAVFIAGLPGESGKGGER
jgi:SAM-dependent methyltransferase